MNGDMDASTKDPGKLTSNSFTLHVLFCKATEQITCNPVCQCGLRTTC